MVRQTTASIALSPLRLLGRSTRPVRREVIKGSRLVDKLEAKDGKLVLNESAEADLENEFFRHLLVEDKLLIVETELRCRR